MNHRLQTYFDENRAHSGLGRQSLHSGVIFVAARSVNVFVQVGSTIVLARLLTPHDYGLVAMVLALVGFAPMLIDLGTADALVQKPKISHLEVSSLFWLNMVLGGALALALAAGSEWIAVLYREPALRNIALVSSITYVMSSASVQHYSLLRRAMRFQRIATVDITANIVSTIAAIAMAAGGLGYWALAVKPVITATISALGVWVSCPWVPGRPSFTKDVREMIGFGANITGFTMADYLARSADRVALGYYYGAGTLGYFQNAFLLYDNLLSIVTLPLHNVAVSSLSKLRENLPELRRSWATALSSLTFFAMPVFALLAVTGQDVVVLLLGDKWRPAGPLLSVFAIRGIAHVVERTLGWLHVSAGRSDRWMRWGLISAICQIIALFVGLPFGVFGVATAYAVTVFFLFLPALAYAGQPLGIKTSDVVRVVGPQMTASLVAVACAGSLQYAWLGEYPQIARVAISTVVCVGVYLLVVVGAFKLTQPIRIALSLGRDFRPTSTLRLRSSTFKA